MKPASPGPSFGVTSLRHAGIDADGYTLLVAVVMDIQGGDQMQEEKSRGAAVNTMHAQLRNFNARELMDALMAADLPLGGTNDQRIERLLSVVQAQDVLQFFPEDARQRVARL